MSNKELPDWPDVSPAGLRKMAEIAAPNNGAVFRAAADEIERLSARAEPSTPPAGPLSSRLRPNVECAPWVIAEVVKLEQAAQPEPAAQDKEAPLRWCAECGEGVTTFCRGDAASCVFNWHAIRAATKPQGGA